MAETEQQTKATGRPPIPYSQDVADEILNLIADGQPLTRILKQNKQFPQVTTIYKWLKQDKVFAEDYARACEDRAETRNDQIAEIVQDVLSGKVDPQAGRVAIDAIKWQAAHEKPNKYGDKMEISGSGVVGLTINVIQRFGDKPAEIEDAQVIVPELPGSCHSESGQPVDNSKSGQKR